MRGAAGLGQGVCTGREHAPPLRAPPQHVSVGGGPSRTPHAAQRGRTGTLGSQVSSFLLRFRELREETLTHKAHHGFY